MMLTVKLRLATAFDAHHGGFATGCSPVSWGSIDEPFVNLTMPSGVIRVHTLTEATGEDATTGLDLLTAVDGPLVRVTADAASDTVAVYERPTATKF